MGSEVVNKNKDCVFNGPYAGRDLYITMYQDSEREFVVTHNANIKPVSYFTGRETELQDLRRRVEEGRKSVLVSGMGGIGKTQICRRLFEEYNISHDNGKDVPFRHIGYIEYDGDMGSSLMKCLQFRKQDDPKSNQEAAWQELEDIASKGKLLLFVDNVNKSMSEDEGLQRLNCIPGAVMITSRLALFSDEFEPYRIVFLNTEQCIKIYEKIRFENSGEKVKPEELEDLKYIIEKLAGWHTITVQLLAHLSWCKKHWSVQRLRNELEENGFQLEFHKNGELVNIQKAYEILYDLSDLTEAEQNILEAFSVFPYIPLAAETCNEWLLADTGVSEEDDILTGLYRKGWLQFDMEHESYSLHPVFAQFIYEKCRPGAETHHGLIEACQEYLEIPESGSAIECQKYIPFAKNIAEKINIGESIEQVKFMDRFAFLLQYKGEYKKAEELYKKVLLIREKVLGKEHIDTATSYNDLAVVYNGQGKYNEAEILYKKALLIYRKVLGERHLYAATTYNNLAMLYRNLGNYNKAKNLCKKCLQIREKLLGENHQDTTNSYISLAVIYESMGKYEEAIELYQKSLRIREKLLGEGHTDIATIYNNLAKICKRQGKYKVSLSYYYKAYIICTSKLGLNHSKTQTVYKNFELAYMEYNPEGNFEQWLEEKMKETEYQ